MPQRRKDSTSVDYVPRIESLAEEIQAERGVRLDILRMDDMVPRGFKRRPRPKTEIIAKAAKVWQLRSDNRSLKWLPGLHHQRTVNDSPRTHMEGCGVKIDWVAPLLIVGFTLLDGLQRWYWSFDRDVMENGLIEWRWISWGTIRARGRPEFDRRYFVIYFPGRHWERDGYRQEYAWHNRGMRWIQGEGWREIFSRCSGGLGA